MQRIAVQDAGREFFAYRAATQTAAETAWPSAELESTFCSGLNAIARLGRVDEALTWPGLTKDERQQIVLNGFTYAINQLDREESDRRLTEALGNEPDPKKVYDHAIVFDLGVWRDEPSKAPERRRPDWDERLRKLAEFLPFFEEICRQETIPHHSQSEVIAFREGRCGRFEQAWEFIQKYGGGEKPVINQRFETMGDAAFDAGHWRGLDRYLKKYSKKSELGYASMVRRSCEAAIEAGEDAVVAKLFASVKGCRKDNMARPIALACARNSGLMRAARGKSERNARAGG